MSERVAATCKFFNQTKGFGFAKLSGQAKDVFFHGTELLPGWSPRPDEPMTLEVEDSPRGLRARAVRPVT